MNSKYKKLSAIAVAATLSLALSGCTLLYPHWGETTAPVVTKTPTDSATATDQPVPSESPSSSATPSSAPKGKAQVTITMVNVDPSSGVLDVIAGASNFSEDGGQCTVRFVSGTVSKTLTVKAEANATDTQCFPMEFQLKDLPKGTGAISVSYDSSAWSGTSSAQSVVIP